MVDAAHGAAYHVAPDVFHELGADVVAIGCSPDGININHEVGATAPAALVQRVRSEGADYGIALDGDADRLLMVDAQGRLYNGDELLYVMVADRLALGQAVPGVVGTLMTNMAVELALRRRDIPLVRAKVGDRYVLEELAERGWQLGGEGSGHLLVLDRHTTGDGIVSALQVMQAVRRRGGSLAELLRDVVLFPQTLLNVRLADGRRLAPEHRAGRDAGRGHARAGRPGPGADPRLGHRTGAARHGRMRRRRAVGALCRAHRRHAALRRWRDPARIAGRARSSECDGSATAL